MTWLKIAQTISDMRYMTDINKGIIEVKTKGNPWDKKYYSVSVADKKYWVINDYINSAMGMVADRVILEAAKGKLPDEIHALKTDQIVLINKNLRGPSYYLTLFHELSHAVQYSGTRKNMSLNENSNKELIKKLLLRELPTPFHPGVNQDYTSFTSELHSHMMHIAREAIIERDRLIKSGFTLEKAIKSKSVESIIKSYRSNMKGHRGSRFDLTKHPDWRGVMGEAANSIGLDIKDIYNKPLWTLEDGKWNELLDRYEKRLITIVHEYQYDMV